MALFKNDIRNIELEDGVISRSFANHAVGMGDIGAERFGIRLFRNGTPVEIGGGQCIGYFIRHETNETVIIDGGTFSGNEAFVTLPQSCYAKPGNFSLAIKLVDGTVTGTFRIVDGTVVETLAGDAVDPGGVIPDIDELLAVIGRAEAAADIIEGIQISAELVSGDNYSIVVSTM